MTDAIELILLSIRTIKDAEHALTFKVQRDDVNRINFAAKIGHQFAATELYPQPAQEDRQRHMAARSETPNRYTQRAVILCNELDFQMFLSTEFPDKTWATAKEAVLDLIEVQSRKEIIEGTPTGDRWERLMIRFGNWKREKNSASAQS